MLDLEKAKLEKHSVTISGHRTSVTLERGFWLHLKSAAESRHMSLAGLIQDIDEARSGSLSGALRSFVLQELEHQIDKTTAQKS